MLPCLRAVVALLPAWALATGANAQPRVEILPTKHAVEPGLSSRIEGLVTSLFDTSRYRVVKAQVIYGKQDAPDHLLVYLAAKGRHRVDFAKVPLGANFSARSVIRDYQPSAADLEQQPGVDAWKATCPDETTEFIVFAPEDVDNEQQTALDVADAARAKGMKVVQLLMEDATRSAYLNYMTCPRVRGNFYDGDASPRVIDTVDGTISYQSFSGALKGKFRHKMTNIWLACQAYKDPMLSSVVDDAETRKYIAGVNDLVVGPSDDTAACAVKAAIAGKPISAAFQSCYSQYDTDEDQWGVGGDGTDDFWD